MNSCYICVEITENVVADVRADPDVEGVPVAPRLTVLSGEVGLEIAVADLRTDVDERAVAAAAALAAAAAAWVAQLRSLTTAGPAGAG
jgi:hypothetical protein